MQAVTFDLWETLMHDSKALGQQRGQLRAQRIHEALTGAGVAISREEVQAACRDVWRTWQRGYWDKHADPGFEAQIDWLRERLGAPDRAIDGVRAGYIDPIFEVPPLVDAEAMPALTRLQARGFRLGLICNTSVTPGFALRRLLDGWGLGQLLTVQLFSDELGIRKPAPAIFREAAQLLGVDVSAMLHIGDRAEIDVHGAIEAGARGLQVGPDVSLSQLVSTITSN